MVDRLAGIWRRLSRAPRAAPVGITRRGAPKPAVPPPADLAQHRGRWVAVRGGSVVAVADTPTQLVYELGKLAPADRADAVIQKAHAPSGAVVIGMG